MNPELPDEKATAPQGAPTGGSGAVPSPPAPAARAAKRPVSVHSLRQGTRLHEFELTDHIGEGGFSIVYRAWDHSLERVVALKEYMPGSLATRDEDTRVQVRNESMQATFDAGLRSFVNESKLLASFDHPSLVKVYRFWEANGTAYMVMPFYEGLTLKDTVRTLPGRPDQGWILEVLAPLAEALTYIHQRQCFHRDIAPDNVLMLADSGRPLLLDFGAARRVINDLSQALTVIVKAGYAPIEQYAAMPDMAQGPWTDVHALAAVVYWMVTGDKPPPAISRVLKESYVPLAELQPAGYSIDFLRAIDRGLALRPENRTRSIEAFAEELGLRPGTSAIVTSLRPRVAEAAPASAPGASTPLAPTTVHPRTAVEPRPEAATAARAPLADDDLTVVDPTGGYSFQPTQTASTAKPAPEPEIAPAPPARDDFPTSPPAAAEVPGAGRATVAMPAPASLPAGDTDRTPPAASTSADALVHPAPRRSGARLAMGGALLAAAALGVWLALRPSAPIASRVPAQAATAPDAATPPPIAQSIPPMLAPEAASAPSSVVPEPAAAPLIESSPALASVPAVVASAARAVEHGRIAAGRERSSTATAIHASTAVSANAAECARIMQRLSLGESSPELLERVSSLHCR
jgi:serine/threonine protein kinase